MGSLKKGDKVTIVNLDSYNLNKVKDKPPFTAIINENIDDFEYWVISDVTKNFYALYKHSIVKNI